MSVSFEVHSGTLRGHPSGDGKFGDPYDWVCGVTLVGRVAYLHGAMRAPKPSYFRDLRARLRQLGVEEIKFERWIDGELKRVVEGSI